MQGQLSLEKHVTILSILYVGTSALLLLLAAVAFLAVVGGGLLSGERQAMVISSTVGTIATVAIGVLALPGIVGGLGLLRRRRWARILVLVLGFIELLSFPLGTALGVYTIWVLMQDEAERHFAAAPASREAGAT